MIRRNSHIIKKRALGPSRLDDLQPPKKTGVDAHRKATLQKGIHVAVALACLLFVFISGEIAAIGVRRQIDARLVAGGAGADAGLVAIEAEQLSLLRAITFTTGVAQALTSESSVALDQAVTPLQANSGVPMVDMVIPDGRVIFAVRSQGAPRPVADRSGLAAIRQSIDEAHGSRGGRFTEVVTLQRVPLLLTIGPLLLASHPIGVALVMTPLADVLGRLASETGLTLTTYERNGSPIATSSVSPPPVAAADAARLLDGSAVETRETAGSTREVLGRLVVDHHATSVLGASTHDDALTVEVLVDSFAAVALVVLGLLAYLLRRRPLDNVRRP